MLMQMNFPMKWCNWIQGVLKSARSSVLLNGSPTFEFKYQRGVRQRDPLSPFLFIIGMEAFSCLLNNAMDQDIFQGFVTPNNGPAISHLLYADDSLIIGKWSVENVKNMARILQVFYMISGLHINFNKSVMYGIGLEQDMVSNMANCLGCKAGALPFIYLRLLVGANMNTIRNWHPVIDVFESRLDLWKSKTLSSGGRLTLLKAVLETLPTYYFSLFKAPQKMIDLLEALRRNFFWAGRNNQNKICWVSWDRIASPIESGGLGLVPLKDANISLLTKWWWRYKVEPTALWRRLIDAIHGSQRAWPSLPHQKGLTGTWLSIARIQNHLAKSNLNLARLIKGEVGNGMQIRFWVDAWIVSQPLREVFPNIYELEVKKSRLVGESVARENGVISWKWRWKRPPESVTELREFEECRRMLRDVDINNSDDKWIWAEDKNGMFLIASMKSVLQQVRNETSGYAMVWNNWVPKKVNIFLWQAEMGRIATMDGLAKRNIRHGSMECRLCGEHEESALHFAHRMLHCYNNWFFSRSKTSLKSIRTCY